MTEEATSRRAYRSDLRDQQRVDTTARIVDAVVRVILDEGVHAFTVANVARRAGVAHRTVYRHFPTRESLLEAVADTLELPPSPDPSVAFDDDDAAERAVRATFAGFAAAPDMTRAVVVASIALGHALSHRERRTEALHRALARRFPRLPSDTLRRAASAVRNTVGSRAWYLLTAELGQTYEEAADTAAWTVRALLAQLERDHRAAPPETTP